MSTPKRATSPLRVAVASFIVTTVEFYDFLIYGTAAALVFPNCSSPTCHRPRGCCCRSRRSGRLRRTALGGIVFGHFGDRVGRKHMLVYSLLITGIATVLMGLLPTYSHIGLAAPILLTLLRLAQGFAVGGE